MLKIKVRSTLELIYPSFTAYMQGMSEAKVEKIKEAAQKIAVRSSTPLDSSDSDKPVA